MTHMSKIALVAAVGAVACVSPAMAGGFSFGFDYARHGRHGHGRAWGFNFEFGRPDVIAAAPVVVPAPVVVAPARVVVAPPPVVVVRPRVWVPPVYRTVTERVWVPTTEVRYRDVPVVDICGNVVSYRREPYTVASGYWSAVTRRVCVREGYWTVGDAPVVAPQGAEAGEPGYASPAPAEPDPEAAPESGNIRYERQQRYERSIQANHSVETILE